MQYSYTFEQEIYYDYMGRRQSRRGSRDLAKAIKLAKQGMVKIVCNGQTVGGRGATGSTTREFTVTSNPGFFK